MKKFEEPFETKSSNENLSSRVCIFDFFNDPCHCRYFRKHSGFHAVRYKAYSGYEWRKKRSRINFTTLFDIDTPDNSKITRFRINNSLDTVFLTYKNSTDTTEIVEVRSLIDGTLKKRFGINNDYHKPEFGLDSGNNIWVAGNCN